MSALVRRWRAFCEMGLLPERCFGYDTDEIFKYRTTRLVVVKDRRLGLLNYCSLLLVILYVFFYEILYNTGYLFIAAPSGGHRFSLREKTNILGCNPVSDEGCFAEVQELSSLDYCAERNESNGNCDAGFYRTSDDNFCVQQRPCTRLDNIDVGIVEGNELLFTTRIFQVAQTNTCRNEGRENCNRLWGNVPGTEEDLYIAGLENFTLLIDHAVQDSTGVSGLADVARNMKGVLEVPKNGALCMSLSQKGRVVKDADGRDTTSAPCWVDSNVPEADDNDVFAMSEWFGAANLGLDQSSGSSTHLDESVRARGHVLVITIEYSNVFHWSGASNEISYVFKVKSLPGSSYKVTSSRDFVLQNSTEILSRKVQKRYGVQIQILQTGRLGAFSFNSLLLQLAAGSALFGISTLVTDFLAMNVLPDKDLYRKEKYKETADFGDIRKRKLQETVSDSTSSPLPNTKVSIA